MSVNREHGTRRTRSSGSGTRERMMDVCESHLTQKGYLGVALEEVAREVGVTKAALYYHFPEGKEQLLVELTHRSLRRAREGLDREMFSEESGSGKLLATARWLMSDPDRMRAMGELKDVVDHVGEEYRDGLRNEFFGDIYSPIHRVIASAIESGEFHNDEEPELLTWAFLGLISGMTEAVDAPGRASAPTPTGSFAPDTMPERTVKLFLRGVQS